MISFTVLEANNQDQDASRVVCSEASLLRLWIVSYLLDQTDFPHPANEKREKSLELDSLFTGAFCLLQ